MDAAQRKRIEGLRKSQRKGGSRLKPLHGRRKPTIRPTIPALPPEGTSSSSKEESFASGPRAGGAKRRTFAPKASGPKFVPKVKQERRPSYRSNRGSGRRGRQGRRGRRGQSVFSSGQIAFAASAPKSSGGWGAVGPKYVKSATVKSEASNSSRSRSSTIDVKFSKSKKDRDDAEEYAGNRMEAGPSENFQEAPEGYESGYPPVCLPFPGENRKDMLPREPEEREALKKRLYEFFRKHNSARANESNINQILDFYNAPLSLPALNERLYGKYHADLDSEEQDKIKKVDMEEEGVLMRKSGGPRKMRVVESDEDNDNDSGPKMDVQVDLKLDKRENESFEDEEEEEEPDLGLAEYLLRRIKTSENSKLKPHDDIFFFQLPTALPIPQKDAEITASSTEGDIKQPMTTEAEGKEKQETIKVKQEPGSVTKKNEELEAALKQFEERQKKAYRQQLHTFDAETGDSLEELSKNGVQGLMRIHESGKVILQFGGISLRVMEGTQCAFHQNLFSLDTKTGVAYELGDIRQRLVCTPDVDELLNEQ